MIWRAMIRIGSLSLLSAVDVATSQERFESGELKGFVKSPTEHIIERLGAPVTASNVDGTVQSKELDKPLGGALVEIRGPSPTEKIISRVTNSHGRFRFGRVREGQYTIKVTLNGFRSVVGTITVRRSVKAPNSLRIQMLHGV